MGRGRSERESKQVRRKRGAEGQQTITLADQLQPFLCCPHEASISCLGPDLTPNTPGLYQSSEALTLVIPPPAQPPAPIHTGAGGAREVKKSAGQARSWKRRHFLDPRHGHNKHTASAMLACWQWGRKKQGLRTPSEGKTHDGGIGGKMPGGSRHGPQMPTLTKLPLLQFQACV